MRTPRQWTNTIWTGVDADLSCYVLIIGAHGEIQFLNAAAGNWLHQLPSDATTRRCLSDIFPQEVAREREEHVGHVLLTGKTLVVDGILLGEGLRCVTRRLPVNDTMQHAALLIFRPLDHVNRYGRDDEISPIVASSNDLGPLTRLTPRETEVLAFIAQGLSSDEVAFRLRRSRRTIDCHRAAISQKLEAHSIADLAVLAHRAGLVRFAADDHAHNGRLESVVAVDLLETIVRPRRPRSPWNQPADAVA